MKQSAEIIFNISKDELPIFLAEVDEHLQVLDSVLIRLEQEESDSELVQTVFRSAHTIKGMAGMIGHQRMTDLTHALETVLDGIRKRRIQISGQLINLCLEAVDHLRLLREEVVTSQMCAVNIDEVVSSLKDFSGDVKDETLKDVSNCNSAGNLTNGLSQDGNLANQKIDAKIEAINNERGTPDSQSRILRIKAKIDANSMASAARAFQLIMALQDLGDIQSMAPNQAQIETAISVREFAAVLITSQSFEKISTELTKISGLDEISLDDTIILSKGLASSDHSQKVVPEQARRQGQIDDSSSLPSKSLPAIPNSLASERRSANPYGRRSTDMTIRANVERLDNLMNLVGELIIDRNHLRQIHNRLTRLNSNYDQIFEIVTHLGHITDQLQEEVMHIRMLPVASIFGKFPRMVHDVSQKFEKLIDVVIEGEETEMDRSMLEEINDPLIHLVRNCIDHGIELPEERLARGKPNRGKITLTARHEEGRIILTVGDDGGGIDGGKLRKSALEKGLISAEEAANLTDEQAIDLMFLAGLSTAQEVTDISGRGVGLDIVNTNIQRVNGSIQVETQLGLGTQFKIVLPLTLAIVPALLVRVQQSTFAIPLVMIKETLRLDQTEIKFVNRKPVAMLRGNILSLIHLSDIFGFSQTIDQRKYLFAVVVESGKRRIGLIVDSLIGEEDAVVKPIGAFIGDIPGISSAAILGEGNVALIVDIFGLFKLAGI